MRDFFTFYTDIRTMELPFLSFSVYHLAFFIICISAIVLLFRYYQTLDIRRQRTFQVRMAIYFLIEEIIYTGWLLLFCHDNVMHRILPLELCSLCVYGNVLTVVFKKDYFRFFSGVVALIAGVVAMVYPANITGIYPVLSYRTINFYCLHASFVLFALIQLKDTSLLSYRYITKNFIAVAGMFTFAFFLNLAMKTQYMFVGTPPEISFIASLYKLTGVVFFLPAVLSVILLLHFVVIFVLRKLYRVHAHHKDAILDSSVYRVKA